ncbi:cysteine and histidine-rich protein 1 homolog [Drosophila innubila]|uniref:cysteine and histidine-rich protein 1 homolog n=1 Tax=Drosophila innubila TaxID=198719 RepID=UPI00148BA0F6|nr:cysteine and histidine-rich protein 1 homolog [Drosophila innubila]
MFNKLNDGQQAHKRQRLDADSDADAESSDSAETQPPSDVSEVQKAGGSGDGARAISVSEPELSERLRLVMLCNVCLELPNPDENYQCSLGHILCEDCVTRLLAEAALKSSEAQCPHCRTPISWKELTKNLAVGQTLCELPKTCADCEQQMEYKSMANHLKMECSKRLVQCQYRCLGCFWEGCQESRIEHESSCKNLKMSSDQILTELQLIDEEDQLTGLSIRRCYRELSAQRIFYQDLELHWPQAPSQQNNEWTLQSPTIFVFENTWRLRVKLVTNTETNHCLSYCLKLLSSPQETMKVKFFATLPATSVRFKHLSDVEQQLNQDQFTHAGQCGDFKQLPMSCSTAIYRLLAMPSIKLRLWMMLH